MSAFSTLTHLIFLNLQVLQDVFFEDFPAVGAVKEEVAATAADNDDDANDVDEACNDKDADADDAVVVDLELL